MTNIPGPNTLKILERRRIYLLKKSQCDIEKNTYLIKEIKALEQVMDFIKWMINNSSDDMIKEITGKYKQENYKSSDEENDEENEGDKEKAEIVYGFLDEKFNKNHIMEIILSKEEGVNYILMESKRRKTDNISWENAGKIKMTLHKLERILRRAYDMENDKSKNNSA
jgi:hypothetical protein